MAKTKLLIVDDEEAIREVVSTLLEALGYECASVSNGRLAKEFLLQHPVDMVLSDMVMPEMDGLSLVEWLRKAEPDIPVIMVTAMHDLSTALEAIRRGAYDYILKPFEKDQLYLSVRRALGAPAPGARESELSAQSRKTGRRADRTTPGRSRTAGAVL